MFVVAIAIAAFPVFVVGFFGGLCCGCGDGGSGGCMEGIVLMTSGMVILSMTDEV